MGPVAQAEILLLVTKLRHQTVDISGSSDENVTSNINSWVKLSYFHEDWLYEWEFKKNVCGFVCADARSSCVHACPAIRAYGNLGGINAT